MREFAGLFPVSIPQAVSTIAIPPKTMLGEQKTFYVSIPQAVGTIAMLLHL